MPDTNLPFPIQVLVVDDSAVVRQVMQSVLCTEADIIVATASDPIIAMRKMQTFRPHVILLDLEMPRMDGLTFLRKVMAEDPIPILICSGNAERGTETALRALDFGAAGIVSKPKLGVSNFLHDSAVILIDMVRTAAQVRVKHRALRPDVANVTKRKPIRIPPGAAKSANSGRIVAIGASTGGTEALTAILTAMPPDAPGIVIVQHMPEHFTAAFARGLDRQAQIEVKEAEDGDPIAAGRALIAPGGRHMSVQRRGTQSFVVITDGPLVSRHRPSVDVLFRSVARVEGAKALGILLTGMGDDGAQGLLEMRNAGAETIAQDEASCVVFGMPKQAIACGAVDLVLPLSKIPSKILMRSRGGAAEPCSSAGLE